MKFSAVILAGGKSIRMGRDKAWLPLDGQPLLARQIAVVRELDPVELFISGRNDTDYSSLGYPVLQDAFPDAGPLAGIAADTRAEAALAALDCLPTCAACSRPWPAPIGLERWACPRTRPPSRPLSNRRFGRDDLIQYLSRRPPGRVAL